MIKRLFDFTSSIGLVLISPPHHIAVWIKLDDPAGLLSRRADWSFGTAVPDLQVSLYGCGC